MSILSDSELRRVEVKYPQGITSAVVVKIFKAKGQRFSEATLRKYVQLGLLPTSRRVGIKGKHRGSSGLYPVAIVRLANEIKKALDQGHSLEDIGMSTIGLHGEIHMLHRSVEQVFDRFTRAVGRLPAAGRATFKLGLQKRRKGLDKEFKGLMAFIEQLKKAQKR